MISEKSSLVYRAFAILTVMIHHYATWMFTEVHHLRLHAFLSECGPPAIDAFLVLSGYGLYKSFLKQGITGRFVLRRITGMVLPYFIVIGAVKLINKEFIVARAEGNLADVVKHYLLATEYWYIHVLFILYIIFILCYRFGGFLELPLVILITAVYSHYLHHSEHFFFWYVSNMSFPAGILLATLEHRFPDIMKKKPLPIAVGATAFAVVCYSWNLIKEAGGIQVAESIPSQIVMNLSFAVFIWALACLLPSWPEPVLPLIGKQSLFIYLIHIPLFWALIFKFESILYVRGAAVVGVITLVVSICAGMLYDRLARIILR